jgi:hypothetical protein
MKVAEPIIGNKTIPNIEPMLASAQMRIEADLWRRFRALSVTRGIGLRQQGEEALREYLERHSSS